jgi:CheY-like chemotaxis protein
VSKILIVEDDQDIRENLKEVLEDHGCEVELAENGQKALALLRSKTFTPSLILLDLMMPVMDGKAFHSAVKADREFSKIPVVVLTAASERFDDPSVELLKKPFEIDKILEKIAKYCGS